MKREGADRKRAADTDPQKVMHDLRERVKELSCLYGISKLVETPGISLEQLLQGTVDLLPPSWQYPEVACARIILYGREFQTEDFRETPWRQASDITAHGEVIGSVEVYYLEERPASDEGPFLKEERSLIDAVGERLRLMVENLRMEATLRERTRELTERVKELNCLYGISKLVETPSISLEQLFQGTADLLPPAWQYPEVACARIILHHQEFQTQEFRETPWRQASDITVNGEVTGSVEVYYLDERPASDEGPFLKEERSLIDAIAQRLGDIVERRQVEEEAQAERRRLRALVDASPAGVLVADAESGRVTLINREARRILGFLQQPRDRLAPAQRAAVYRRPDGQAYAVEELPLERALRSGETVSAEEMFVEHPDGRAIPTLVSATPVYSADGRITSAVAVIQDITPLEEAERLRSEFLGMVSHELKTPLTAIKGAAATALGTVTPLDKQEIAELFQIIDEQGDRLRDLVGNLLDMTHIEAGRLSVSPEPVDLRAILEEAQALFVRGGGLQALRIKVPDELPPVSADAGRIVQVVANLLANAARFSPPAASITVEVEHDSVSATVHVRDRGKGIPRDRQRNLFKKFARLHEDEGRKLSGSGLGLAICKGIVEAHGGRIWVESAGEGKGATFSFTLPIASGTSVISLSEAARSAVHRRKVTRTGDRTRVLAVDDEPQILRYFKRTLDSAGYEAIVTGDPSQVAELVDAEEPDLILLDLIMPEISGFDLLRRIREFSNVPVIIVTASEREEDTVQALKMGADDYVIKPFSQTELFARIEAVLRRRVSPDLLGERPPFALGELRINLADRRVEVGGQLVSLSVTEYKLLYELATNAGRLLTHDQLLKLVWGPGYEGQTGLLRSFVNLLRGKLGDDGKHPRFIFTERGVGYRMPRPEG